MRHINVHHSKGAKLIQLQLIAEGTSQHQREGQNSIKQDRETAATRDAHSLMLDHHLERMRQELTLWSSRRGSKADTACL